MVSVIRGVHSLASGPDTRGPTGEPGRCLSSWGLHSNGTDSSKQAKQIITESKCLLGTTQAAEIGRKHIKDAVRKFQAPALPL